MEQKLREQLSEQQHALLTEYSEAFMKLMDTLSFRDFSQGYRMGVQLMIEALLLDKGAE